MTLTRPGSANRERRWSGTPWPSCCPLYALNLPYIQGAYAGQIQVFERAISTPAGGVRHSLDIDDFKLVNDHPGHGAGDQVRIESAARMRRAVRESDSVTRMGGDEFLMLAPQIETGAQVEALAARLLETVRQPLQLGAATLTPTFSLGIARYAQDGLTPKALIANSDRAL